jgi:hypothetical protein
VVTVVFDIPFLRDIGFDVLVELRVVLGAKPCVNPSRCASCFAWAVLCEISETARIHNGCVGVRACADFPNFVVFGKLIAEDSKGSKTNVV